MRTTILLFTFMLLFSCNSSDDKTISTVHNVSIEFRLTDNDGKDLLNPLSTNTLDHSSIKLFYKKDGIYEEFYENHLDYPRNIMIYKHKMQNKYRARVFLNSNTNDEYPETLIKWNESKSDTIKASFSRSKNNTSLNKIWLNNTLIWNSSTATEDPIFELIH